MKGNERDISKEVKKLSELRSIFINEYFNIEEKKVKDFLSSLKESIGVAKARYLDVNKAEEAVEKLK